VRDLISAGIQPQVPVVRTSKLNGKSFVITGTLSINRNEAKKIVEENGGKTLSSLSKKADFLIAGESAGSKLKKAGELGIPVISWDEFLQLL
jgi:DNA ligase (NAD+)